MSPQVALKWTMLTVDLDTLHGNIRKGKYWMDPPHQRDVVHPDKWQSKIVESYMKGYLVPSATFDVYTDEDSKRLRSIDGKQRTMAIFRYLNDEYPYMCDFPENMKGKKFSELSQKDKNILLYKEATINVANRQLTYKEIEDMFSRMQETKKTSLGELLNSHQMTSPIIGHILKSMGEFEPFFVKVDKRHERLELIVRMYYGISAFHANETNKIDVPRSKLIEWTKTFKIENLPGYTSKLVKNSLSVLKECKTKHNFQKTFVLPLTIVLGKQIINKQTTKVKKERFKTFSKFVKTTDIIYPQVGGSHSATDTRIPILEGMYNQYNEQ